MLSRRYEKVLEKMKLHEQEARERSRKKREGLSGEGKEKLKKAGEHRADKTQSSVEDDVVILDDSSVVLSEKELQEKYEAAKKKFEKEKQKKE